MSSQHTPMIKRFKKINIEISNICNLHCSFCPDVNRPKKIMNLELFEKIIHQVASLTDQVCLHLMGEPLLHPQLSDLIASCEKTGVKIFFVSNGLLLSQKHFPLLLSPALSQVNFSLHSFGDNFPDRDPTGYLQSIFNFTEIALKERPDLYINYRLWNLSDNDKSNDWNHRLLTQISQHYQKDPKQIIEMATRINLRRQKSLHLKDRLYLHFDSEFIWPSLDLPLKSHRGTCYGLSSHFGILVDGTVVPCCLDKEGAISLGNIQEQNILDILSNPRAKALLEGFKQEQLVEDLCQRCQYAERFTKKLPKKENLLRREK